MAVASLVLSFLAFFVPFGIASVVMGHMSRTQIAKSNGRQTGAGLAFAGLILSYLQFAVVAVMFLALIPVWHEMNHDLDRDQYVRAALVERFLSGDPSHPSAAALVQRHKDLIDALHLVRARQDSYRESHPEGYACSMNDLGSLGEDQELSLHLRESNYDFQALCRRVTDDGYVITAVPRNDSNPPDSPMYCLDQTKVIRKYYSLEQAREVTSTTFYQHESCPQDGETVE